MDLSLRKNEKLRYKTEFEQIRENGKKFVGRMTVLVVAPAPDGQRKCGVICSRKYSKLAVRRNRARRLLYESFRTLKIRTEIRHYLMIPRFAISDARMEEVRSELLNLLGRAGVLSEESRRTD